MSDKQTIVALQGQTVKVGRDRIEVTETTEIPGIFKPGSEPKPRPQLAYVCSADDCAPQQKSLTPRKRLIPVMLYRADVAILAGLGLTPVCAFCARPMHLAEPGTDFSPRRSRNTPQPVETE